ncbi:MAG TPA: transglycosylase domain-containing protein [Mycobacteriales bacterium]|jgi:penicillin-binding protein 1A
MAQTTLPGRGGGGNPAPPAAVRVRRRRRFPYVRWTLLAAFVAVVSFVAGMLVAPIDLTVPARLPTALLLDSSERFYASIRAPEIREDVASAEIPEVLRNAVIAAEDERFFSHKGVDPVAIGRAAYRDVFDNGRTQGGSTITQQWVKNIYVGREKTALRKMREAVVAYRAEKEFGKAEILHRYLNSVYLGNGTYGVQAAAKYYFGVPVKDLALDKSTGRRSPVLELARAAMLAGMINAPSLNNPVKSLPNAKARQLYALDRMSDNRFISVIDASRAYRQPLVLAKEKPAAEATEAPIFTDMVTAELKQRLTDDELYGGGLRVRTTLDLIMQRAVEQAVFQTLPGLNPATADPEEPDAAVVAVDPRTGDLKAIYSSRYVRNGFNLAEDARVQTGSAIKPFTLATALQNGRTLDTVYPGPSCKVVSRKPYYRPCNAERGGGSYTLKRALAHSVNTVYAQLAVDVGTTKVRDTAIAAGMGPASGIGTNPAMSLGAINVSPLSVAQAYATLAAGGVRRDLRLVLEERRNADTAKTFSGVEVMKADPAPPGKQVIPKDVAAQVVEAMYDVVERGTARNARVPGMKVFGKTGSTNLVTNAWFAGCVPELCVVTWLGHKSGVKPLGRVHGVKPVFGGTLPAIIFSRFWKHHAALVAAEAAKEAGIGASPSASASPTRRRPRTRTPSPVAPPPSTPVTTTAPPVSPTATGTPAPTATVPPPPTTAPPPTTEPPPSTPAADGSGGPAPP